MLRRLILIALLLSVSVIACARQSLAAAPLPQKVRPSSVRLLAAGPQSDLDEPSADSPAVVQPDSSPELFPVDSPPESEMQQPFQRPPASLEDYSSEAEFDAASPDATPSESFFSKLKWLGLRHSSHDGRNAGMGVPLVGTSWLNRPYYVGVDLGTVWITQPPQNDVTRDIDIYGGIYGGCDFDYYWGAELAIQRATPELINENARDADRGDRLMVWTANVMYYPWGDSMFRPYWRCGLGGMEIDHPTDAGHRREETLWTFPVGLGIKYPVRRWLAARAEFTDQIGLGNDGVATQHDLTLTFALEWRFGAHPRSYWPWNPSHHIW